MSGFVEKYSIGPEGISQDEKNSILRPNKVKFLNSAKRNPQKFMNDLARCKLKGFVSERKFITPMYYKFLNTRKRAIDGTSGSETGVMVPNLDVPPLPPLTAIVDLDGKPFMDSKTVYCTEKLKDGKVRRVKKEKKVQKRMSDQALLVKSYEILDQVFYFLEDLRIIRDQGQGEVHGPLDWLHCR